MFAKCLARSSGRFGKWELISTTAILDILMEIWKRIPIIPISPNHKGNLLEILISYYEINCSSLLFIYLNFRFVVFHCTEYDGIGGASLLVDGFHVAKQLKQLDPEAYDYLSTTSIESEYIEPGNHFFSFGPWLRHDTFNHQLEQIR